GRGGRVGVSDIVPTTLLGSASKLSRSLECPASVHLPQKPKPPHVQKAGNRGKGIHRFLQLAPTEGVERALEDVPEQYHAFCRKLPLDKAAGRYTPLHRREMAFAHHGQTGDVRELACEDRDYGDLAREETPGTFDVVIAGYNTAEVWDYKTGKTPVPPPDVNPQLLHGALCVAETIAPRAERFVLGIQTIVEGDIISNAAVVDRWALESHESRI